LKAIEGTPIRTGHVTNVYYDLVLAELKSGDHEQAKQHYAKGVQLVELAPRWWQPRFDFLKGLLRQHENESDYNFIEKCYKKSIEGDAEVGAVVPAAQTRYYLAKLIAQAGDLSRAFEMFTDLSSFFETCNIPVWQHKCRRELEPYRF
jgi:hypothetical protein